VAEAIKDMVVRGAPAIGVAAAMGVALGARDIKTEVPAEFERELERICEMTSPSIKPWAATAQH
jgi:methylthioribose-1-phosphate isomerase